MKCRLALSFLLLIPYAMAGQTREAANQLHSSLQVGGEFSLFNGDFYCSGSSPFDCGNGQPLMKGLGVFIDYDTHTPWESGRWGAEGEFRWLHWGGHGGQVESTYLGGPRCRIYRWRKLDSWGKFLLGSGAITTAGFPGPNTLKGSFFVYAPGGSVDYRLTPRLSARLDYELQKWPDFGVAPPHNHSITPSGFSFGVNYRLFR